MQQVTTAQLSQILEKITRSTIVSMTYKVDESKSRTVKGQKQLQKEVSLTAYLNHDYTNKVVKLTGNTDFVADPMKGKKKIAGPIIANEKTDERMLYATVLKSNPRKTTYFHQGEPITKEDAIAKDLFAPSFFENTDTKGRGRVSEHEDFALISPYLKNIIRLKVEGQEFEVVK
jgi:hypothetical protein